MGEIPSDGDMSVMLLGFLYATGATLLFITSYILYIKRFKRSKLLAVNEVTLTTSRYDVYSVKTQFLMELPKKVSVKLVLLNEQEQVVKTLVDEELDAGENVVDFDPALFEVGNYYLSLKTEGTSILRRIKIAKND